MDLLFLGGVWSLRNLTISVPRGVLSGEGQAAVLRCSYDLEGAALYSIRWYRAETEFYRYVPREMPPTLVFPLPGASVDVRIAIRIKITLCRPGVLSKCHHSLGAFKMVTHHAPCCS